MTKRDKPNLGNLEGLAQLRGAGHRVDSTARGPRVDLTRLYDFVFGAIETGRHPISALRDAPRKVQGAAAISAALLVGVPVANYISHTPEFETPQGVEEVNLLGKNVDDLAGVEEARVRMYISELPGVFSESGQEQLRTAALQSDNPPFLGGGDLEKTQRGLDAMIVVSQIVEAHDLGEGRFLEFHDEEIEQLRERLGEFVDSGLASEAIEELHSAGDIEGIVSGLQDLGNNRDVAHAILAGKEVVELGDPNTTQTLEGPEQGR